MYRVKYSSRIQELQIQFKHKKDKPLLFQQKYNKTVDLRHLKIVLY